MGIIEISKDEYKTLVEYKVKMDMLLDLVEQKAPSYEIEEFIRLMFDLPKED